MTLVDGSQSSASTKDQAPARLGQNALALFRIKPAKAVAEPIAPTPKPAQQALQFKHLRHLSESAKLEERPDHLTLRLAIWGISGSLLCLLVWTAFARLPEVVRANGQIMPQSFERELVHNQSGRVVALNVQPGDAVTAGEIVARFDDNDLRVEREIAQSLNLSLQLQIERLSAFVEGRQPEFAAIPGAASEIRETLQAYNAMTGALQDQSAVIKEQISKNLRDRAILQRQVEAQHERLAVRQELLTRREHLFERDLVVFPVIMEARQELADAQAELDILERQLERNMDAERELKSRLSSMVSARRSEARQQLQQAHADLSESQKRIAGIDADIDARIIRAPVDGVIKLPDRIAVGDYLNAGEPLGHVVPSNDPLVARVRIPARDISDIHIGQSVDLKITSLDFVRFGKLEGEILKLAPAAISSESGEVYYTAEVTLSRESLDRGGREYPLIPGMVVSAEIVNGSRTVLQYLFKPVKVAFDDAFKEE